MKDLMKNMTVRIGAMEIPGCIELTKTGKSFDNSGCFSKFILLLQEYFGFSYEVNKAGPNSIDELLIKNKTDFSIPIPQSFERSKIMNFSSPFTNDGIKFFVGRPAELSKITAIIYPFFVQVWIAIFISFIISMIMFTIIFWKDSKLYNRKLIKINEIAWALFGSFTGQGNNLFSPAGKSCKLLVSGWILAVFVIISSYNGALMSFISFPGRESIPRTFSELVKVANKGDYIISLPHKSTIGKFISNSTEGDGLALKKLFELNKLEDNWLNKFILERVLKEKLAYIWYENNIAIQTSSFGSDNFLSSKDQLYSLNTGFGISRTFPYMNQLNMAILRFVEAGIIMKFINDEIVKREREYYSKIREYEEVFHVLTFSDLAGPLSLLIFGYILSLIVLFVEILKSKLYRSK